MTIPSTVYRTSRLPPAGPPTSNVSVVRTAMPWLATSLCACGTFVVIIVQAFCLANGADPDKFFDALSLSAVAAHVGMPILLVGANTILFRDQGCARSSLRAPDDSPATSRGVRQRSTKSVRSLTRRRLRWAGPDRYATAATVAQEA